MSSIAAVKDSLQKLGLPTSTPGLYGDERLEELKFRLQSALKMRSEGDSWSQGVVDRAALLVELERDGRLSDSRADIGENIDISTSQLSQLSMAEIRSRLMVLGGNTTTPGLAGEDRRQELLSRLAAIVTSNAVDVNAYLNTVVHTKYYCFNCYL